MRQHIRELVFCNNLATIPLFVPERAEKRTAKRKRIRPVARRLSAISTTCVHPAASANMAAFRISKRTGCSTFSGQEKFFARCPENTTVSRGWAIALSPSDALKSIHVKFLRYNFFVVLDFSHYSHRKHYLFPNFKTLA